MRLFKQIVYFTTATIVILVGLVFIAIPFLPFGWLFSVAGFLLLAPYFKTFKKGLEWLASKDRTGATKKVVRVISNFYRWAHGKEDSYMKEIAEKSGTNSD